MGDLPAQHYLLRYRITYDKAGYAAELVVCNWAGAVNGEYCMHC